MAVEFPPLRSHQVRRGVHLDTGPACVAVATRREGRTMLIPTYSSYHGAIKSCGYEVMWSAIGIGWPALVQCTTYRRVKTAPAMPGLSTLGM